MSDHDLIEAEKEYEQGEDKAQGAVAEATPDDGVAPVEPGEAGAEGMTVAALGRALEELQGKADAYFNDLLRARAEAENLRKRTARDIENAHKYGQERFIAEMLPVKDSMELGVSAAASATDVATLREGMELTLKAFGAAFEKLGLTTVDPAGAKFNPEWHQAISTQESDAEPGTVLTVVQKGYRLNDRLIRPALVIVARAKEA